MKLKLFFANILCVSESYIISVYFWSLNIYSLIHSFHTYLFSSFYNPGLPWWLRRLSIWETRVQSLGWEAPWRRKWQSTPVLLPGKSHGQRSLVGYSPWGGKESDTTEWSSSSVIQAGDCRVGRDWNDLAHTRAHSPGTVFEMNI